MAEKLNRDLDQRFTRVTPLSLDKTYNEGFYINIATGTTAPDDKTVTLAQGATNKSQVIERVKMNFYSGTGQLKFIVYDGTGGDSDSTQLTGELFEAAQPDEGFYIGRPVASGKLGIRVLAGTGDVSKQVQGNVLYTYT